MRVISGKARSLRLKTIDGDLTRPTTDRIKETLFNIIGNNVIDSVFLDLFSGSGGIGIEALSRGAARCDFVDNNPKCIKVINDNLAFTKLLDGANVVKSDVLSFISSKKGKKYDIIFIDPPYRAGVERDVLNDIMRNDLCHSDTVIILEALKEFDESIVGECGFVVDKVKVYGSNKHIFMGRRRELWELEFIPEVSIQ